jgi:hypothetical protein
MLRNAKRPANIGKSSRYAETTRTPKCPIAMNSVLWLPRTPGHRPFRASITTAVVTEHRSRGEAATRKLPTETSRGPGGMRKFRLASPETF